CPRMLASRVRGARAPACREFQADIRRIRGHFRAATAALNGSWQPRTVDILVLCAAASAATANRDPLVPQNAFAGKLTNVLRGAYGASLRQLPFLPYLALRSLLYLGVILLVLIASDLPVGITRADIAFSLGLSLGYNLLLGVNDLLGPGVLFAFVAGRYHHPRREERILLFIDMRAPTAIAERLGEERFLDFLNRFITDLSLAIAEAGGEIHKYVGDEIIATWTLAAG